mmetsp:Transcript_57090/g.93900  ORF Transcript_57090/g.93900 Transcript_57090/m.93900 type:complete len:91 (-) Transcript_57090:1031-1303(-)
MAGPAPPDPMPNHQTCFPAPFILPQGFRVNVEHTLPCYLDQQTARALHGTMFEKLKGPLSKQPRPAAYLASSRILRPSVSSSRYSCPSQT